jgi:amino acid adenylation domain-containing protein
MSIIVQLRTDRVRPEPSEGLRNVATLVPDPNLWSRLDRLCRSPGARSNVAEVAAFACLVARYTQSGRVLFAVPASGSRAPASPDRAGPIAEPRALDLDLSGDPTFLELLDLLTAELAAGPEAGVVPPSPIAPSASIALAFGLTGPQATRFEISVAWDDSAPDGPRRLVADFDADLFEEATITRLLAHYLALLLAAATDPGTRLWRLPLLSPEESTQLLRQWNDTRRPYPEDQTIPELFAAAADRVPQAVAVTTGRAGLTYAELDLRAEGLAARLRGLGVGPDVVVGVCLRRSLDLITGILGVVKAGGAYLALDPDYPAERLGFMLADTRAPVILTDETLLAALPTLAESGAAILRSDGDGNWPEAPGTATPSPEAPLRGPALSPDNLAYVSYTSGSTGRPKGVAVPHRAVIRLVMGANFARLTSDEVFLQLAPVSFDASTLEIWGALLHGATLILAPPGALSLEDIGRTVAGNGVTILWLTAGLFSLMIDSQIPALSGLRQLLFGGDVVPLAHVAEAARRLPGVALINGYGPTENTTFTACYRLTGDPARFERTLPIGRPVTNTTVYVLDRRMNPVPVGAPGELYTGGAGLARGYLGRPDQTAESFVPDPFSLDPGGRLYRTGDLVRFHPDGNLEFLGRIDQQVKVRGFRVELGEIETALAGHEEVKDVVAVAREDRPGDKRLVAYVVPVHPGRPERPSRLTARVLRDYLASRLPEWMLPSAFVFLESLPLGPTGKVNRGILPAPERPSAGVDPKGPLPGPHSSSDRPAPTDLETALLFLWRETLGLDRIDLDDDFFDLGGHSLLATQIITRVRQRMGLELPMRAIFENPTIATLALAIEGARKVTQTPPLVRRAVDRAEAPLSFAQERLLFFDRLVAGSALYNVPVTMRLEGHLDHPALEEALREIVRRHEILRTVYITSPDGETRQIVSRPEVVAVPVVDLTGIASTGRAAEAGRWAEAERLAVAEARRLFDLSKGPLLRALLLRLDPYDHLLVLSIHHIAFDGWSTGILARELTALYGAFVQGRPSPLPPLPVQYADFAHWQRECLRGETLDEHVTYWREKLSGLPPLVGLPVDRPRPAVQSFRGHLTPFSWPAQVARALDLLCREEGVTRFMALFAAFAAFLFRYSRQSDLPVGVAIANRTRVETENLIGFFVNTLPIRTDLSGDPTFRQLLQRVKTVALEAYAHQDLPFEKLVGVLQPERNLSHMPIVQVLFAYQSAPFEPPELTGLQVSQVTVDKLDTGTAKTDLVVTLEESEEGLTGYFQLSADIFEPTTAARMVRHFRILLEGALANPGLTLSVLPLVSSQEQEQLLRDSSGAISDYPEDWTINELFEKQVRSRPEAAALLPALPPVEGRRTETMTYAELDRRSGRLADYLERLGVTSETLVGIALERSFEMIVGLLGILKAGGAYVPLDPGYPAERLAFIIEDTRMPIILSEERLLGGLPLPRDGSTRVVCLDRDWADAEAGDTDPSGRTADTGPGGRGRKNRAWPDSLAAVFYTSGSTGRPKGVGVTHRGVGRMVRDTDYLKTGPDDVFLQTSTLSFDASTFEIWTALAGGGKLILPPPGIPDLVETGRILAGYGVTIAFFTTALFNLLVEEEPACLAGLRYLLFGGEAASTAHALRASALLPAGCVLNAYGPTENTTFTTTYQVHPSDDPGRPLPIGRPIANTTVYVLDPNLTPVPTGVPGELYTGGLGLARGYLGRPDLTAERFIPDALSGRPGARLYRTGDLARLRPDGRLEFLGRLDDQVKVRGFRIELGEIEVALARHPEVAEAIVTVAGDQSAEKRLVAYVIRRSTASALDAPELERFLAETLPRWMLPGTIIFPEAFPLGPTGKVDRGALLKMVPESAPKRSAALGGAGRGAETAETSPLEEAVARVWALVLGREAIQPGDNFFELGGQSLLAIRLASRLRDAFDVDFTVRAVFEHPTLRGQAALLDAGLLPPAAPAPPAVIALGAIDPDQMTEAELDAFLSDDLGEDERP